ncbi:3-oxoadipate enol-lactonase [Virgisporangium aliadipatigenens]|uniref:3-oxoadipate enol-lactonase n=1 Tax=Virgisporangium aliadipatigenens TaxID=741659 RepID=A0A8J4DT54_9ACTN|nr:3-oxoadipate enol-lactonase [Virgisporangium aliadipatigenens]GIJ49434.1 3-oxoadipate enol-lactonase [Virgisporangium aliadipatigenens]
MSELDYDLSGPDGAPVLVLGGSLGSTRAMWEPQLATLSGVRLLRYDHLGHGGSAVPPGPYSLDRLGEELLLLLEKVGAARVSYAGLSLGGMVGMWLAAHHPDRVERLALLCTAAFLPPAAGWLERARLVRAEGTGAVAPTVVSRWLTPAYASAHPDEVRRLQEMIASTPPEGYAGCCEAIAAMDLRPVIGRISAPTLVIAGQEDPATPPEHARAIASSIPGARFASIPDAAHLASHEQAATVNHLLREHFLG